MEDLAGQEGCSCCNQCCNQGDVSQRQRWVLLKAFNEFPATLNRQLTSNSHWQDRECGTMLGNANTQYPPILNINHNNHPRQPRDAAALASHLHPFLYAICETKFALPSAILMPRYDSFPPVYPHNYSHPKIMLMLQVPRLNRELTNSHGNRVPSIV